MRVLIACEFSGVVRDAFAARGHDAWSCDLLPSDRPGNHIQDNVLNHLDRGWDLMVAHPPCTWLCRAQHTNAMRKDRPKISAVFYDEREKAKAFFIALHDSSVPRVAVENPLGYINESWRKYDQLVRPFMFGHPYFKPVCLWLKNLKPLAPHALFHPGPYKKLDVWSSNRNPNGRSVKSITFSGIAFAMAEQWGKL